MKIGQAIRTAFNLYLNNPIIILPFLLLGIFRSFLNIVILTSFNIHVPSTNFFKMPLLLSNVNTMSELSKLLFNFLLLLLLISILIIILNSFVEAYAIGVAKKLTSKKLSFSFKLPAIVNGLQIFVKKLIILGLALIGGVILLFPLVILFGLAGVVLSSILFLIYVLILLVIELFASQSIVIDKVNAWKGIVNSYHFVKKNLEGVAVLILFFLVLYGGVLIIKAAAFALGVYLLNGFPLLLYKQGINIILYSIVLLPFIVILKTTYFIKNK